MASFLDFLFGSNEEQPKVAPTLTDVKPRGSVSSRVSTPIAPLSSQGSMIFNVPIAQRPTTKNVAITPLPPKPIPRATVLQRGAAELKSGASQGLFDILGGARSADDEEIELARIAMNAGDTVGARTLLQQYQDRKDLDRKNDPMAFIHLSDEYYPPDKVEQLWRGLTHGIGEFLPTALLTGFSGTGKKAATAAAKTGIKFLQKGLGQSLAREAGETAVFTALRSQSPQEFKENAITDFVTLFPGVAAFHGGSVLLKKGGNALMELLSRAGAKNFDFTQPRLKAFLEGAKDAQLEEIWTTLPTESKAILLQSRLDESAFLQSKTPSNVFAELRNSSAINEKESFHINEKERSYLKNIVLKENVDPVRKEIASKIYPKTYRQLPNKAAIEFGEEYVAKDTKRARQFIDEPISEDSGAFQIATANALQKRYQDLGMFEEAAAMDAKIDVLAREGGRMAQIIRAIYRGTPESRMRSAIIATNKILKEAELPPLSKEALGKMNDLKNHADQIQERIDQRKLNVIKKSLGQNPDQMSMKLEMEDLYEQQRALRDMEQIAEDLIPSTLLDRYETFHIGNMLSAPTTQATNTASATLNTGIRGVTTQVESLIESFKYIAKRNPQEAKNILKQVNFLTYIKDLSYGFDKAKIAFKDTMAGKKPVGEKFNELSARRRNVLKGTGKATKSIIGLQANLLRIMSASDQFFKTLNKYPEFREAKFLQKLEDDALAAEHATRAAETTILSNELDPFEKGISLVEQAARGFGRVLQSGQKSSLVGPAYSSIQSHIIPFVKVLMNMTGYGLKHTPLGFIPGIKTGKLSKRSFAEAITGTAAMTLFAGIGLDTTWSAPQDKSLRDAFYNANKQPFSFRIPGTNKWVSYQYAGPLAPAIAFIGALKYHSKENPDALLNSDLEKISRALLGTVAYAFTQSPARGIQNALSLLTETSGGFNQDQALKSLGFASTQTIPLSSLGRWANNYFLDGIYRKSEGAVDEWLKTIPGASRKLKPYKNTETGEEQTREPINAILPFGGLRTSDPTFEKKYQEKVQKRQVTRLTNKGNDILTEILGDTSLTNEEKKKEIQDNPILQRYLKFLKVK